MRSILLAGGLALFGTLFGTRFAIGLLVKRGYGQFIRDDGPTSQHTKRGTPTMGGIVIICSVIFAYVVGHLITWTAPTASGLLVLYLFAGLGLVGFLDDWTKISKARSLGLNSRAKLAGQALMAISFAILSFQFPNDRGLTPASAAVSFLRDLSWLQLPVWLAVIWIVLIIASWSNAATSSTTTSWKTGWKNRSPLLKIRKPRCRNWLRAGMTAPSYHGSLPCP